MSTVTTETLYALILDGTKLGIFTMNQLRDLREAIDQILIDSGTEPSGPAQKIIIAVCTYFKITARTLFSRSREDQIVWPRMLAELLIYETGEYSLQATGQIFGKDHGTVLSNIRSAKNRIETSTRFKRDNDAVRSLLSSSASVTSCKK